MQGLQEPWDIHVSILEIAMLSNLGEGRTIPETREILCDGERTALSVGPNSGSTGMCFLCAIGILLISTTLKETFNVGTSNSPHSGPLLKPRLPHSTLMLFSPAEHQNFTHPAPEGWQRHVVRGAGISNRLKIPPEQNALRMLL